MKRALAQLAGDPKSYIQSVTKLSEENSKLADCVEHAGRGNIRTKKEIDANTTAFSQIVRTQRPGVCACACACACAHVHVLLRAAPRPRARARAHAPAPCEPLPSRSHRATSC